MKKLVNFDPSQQLVGTIRGPLYGITERCD